MILVRNTKIKDYFLRFKPGLPYFGGTFWGHILGAQGHIKGHTWIHVPRVPFRVPLKKIVPKRAQYGSPESRKHYIIKRN